jgi:hypothetical protein
MIGEKHGRIATPVHVPDLCYTADFGHLLDRRAHTPQLTNFTSRENRMKPKENTCITDIAGAESVKKKSLKPNTVYIVIVIFSRVVRKYYNGTQ